MENLFRIASTAVMKYYRIALVAFILMGFVNALTPAQSTAANSANSVLCNLYLAYSTVQTAIFVIGILLMILGGSLYAGSHVMPGQSKGTMQGYAMGMIMGGIIGVIIAVLAPYIFSLIVGNQVSTQIGSGPTGC